MQTDHAQVYMSFGYLEQKKLVISKVGSLILKLFKVFETETKVKSYTFHPIC